MKPLGLLGGGQLARMLALKAHEMGVPVAVYSSSSEDPAAHVVSYWSEGRLDDRVALGRFLKSCSVATFESEFMDANLLAQISRSKGSAKIFPQPKLMGALQDRLTQKRLMATHGLPTSDFVAIDDTADARAAFMFFEGRVVFKKRRFGYDGYGTWIVRSKSDLEKFVEALKTDQRSSQPVGFIAERFVPFKREVALLVTRTKNGTRARFPFVETHQENARCLWVQGPLKTSKRFEDLASRAERFLAKTGYVGLMAIELFETSKGELVVNEIAPRVHNSGHYSLEALDTDQFTMHLKCVLGQTIRSPRAEVGGFAMVNLLGHSSRDAGWRAPTDVKLHWYGKDENRKGRKMGHLTALARKPEIALKLALARRKDFDV